ncbi:MAG: radical SAM protein [Patescibacteria group bacterium]|nr:radical SAM protein [Patescibacteria group bacterium]
MSRLKLDTPVRFSRFLHFVELDDGVAALYNALSQAVVYTSGSVVTAIRSVEQPFTPRFLATSLDMGDRKPLLAFLRQLWNKKMLLEPDEDETIDVEKLRGFLEEPAIAILYLLLTDACNIACRYCFFEGGIPDGYKFSLMSAETARKGVDLLARFYSRKHLSKAKEGPHIILYGGEPLMNWSVVEQTLQYIRELRISGDLPRNTQITLNTNGILMTLEIARILIKHGVSIAISLDGPACMHDQMRVDHQGQGTYDSVMSSITMLREMGANVGTCCTIDSHNIDHLEDVTHWMISNLGMDSLGFNTLLESTARPIPNPKEYGPKVGDKLVSCFEIARSNGVHEDRFMRKVRSFVQGDFYFADCGGCGMQIAMAPNGDVGTCHAFCGTREYFVTPNETFDPGTHPYWEEWRRRSPINMERCLDCIALANCGGGCPHNSHIKSGSIWEVDEVFCQHAIRAVNFLIQDLYVQRES